MFRLKILLGLGLAVALGVGTASADTFSYDLTLGNTALNNAGATGPYGTVTVTLDSSTQATVEFLAASGYKFIDGGSVAVFTGSGVTFGAITSGDFLNTTAPNGDPIYTAHTGTNNNTFGNTTFYIDSFDGQTYASNEINFTLINTSGTWSSASQVLTNNDQGHPVVAHVTTVPTDGSTPVTGFVTTGSVPEPSTMAIAGLGALGFIGYGLRRRRTK
jgi:hypothetical protein